MFILTLFPSHTVLFGSRDIICIYKQLSVCVVCVFFIFSHFYTNYSILYTKATFFFNLAIYFGNHSISIQKEVYLSFS